MEKRRVAAVAVCSLMLTGCTLLPVTPSHVQDPVSTASTNPALSGPAGSGQTPASAGPLPASLMGPPAEAALAVPAPHHVNVHGLYMTGWTAGSDKFYELVDYMKKSGLNAVVIDAQDDDGSISWDTDIPLAKEIGSNERKIPDPEARVKYLHDHGIYAIARIVVYADPLLGQKRPDMAILGGKFADSRGIRWPDPYNKQVWAYKVDIARDAVARGFDEIQFDYIRFPEHLIEGYNVGVPVSKRTDAIDGFLKYAKQELSPLGVFVSADVFGLTTSVEPGDDMQIGQDYTKVANVVDYILPMVYPSHYAPGTYGIGDPNSEPGEIVYQSMKRALERTPGIDVTHHRPWIQDFNYGKHYTAADVEAQITGLARAGIHQWILWDPNNRYTRTVDYSVGDAINP